MELNPSDLTRYGLVSVKLDGAPTGDGQWAWRLDFKWNSELEEGAAEAALLLEHGQPVCFVGDAKASVGSADFSDQGRSSSGGKSEGDFTITWGGIPTVERSAGSMSAFMTQPEPGETVTVGVVAPKPVLEYRFVTPRPK